MLDLPGRRRAGAAGRTPSRTSGRSGILPAEAIAAADCFSAGLAAALAGGLDGGGGSEDAEEGAVGVLVEDLAGDLLEDVLDGDDAGRRTAGADQGFIGGRDSGWSITYELRTI